jgi:hypothetical protein
MGPADERLGRTVAAFTCDSTPRLPDPCSGQFRILSLACGET